MYAIVSQLLLKCLLLQHAPVYYILYRSYLKGFICLNELRAVAYLKSCINNYFDLP